MKIFKCLRSIQKFAASGCALRAGLMGDGKRVAPSSRNDSKLGWQSEKIKENATGAHNVQILYYGKTGKTTARYIDSYT